MNVVNNQTGPGYEKPWHRWQDWVNLVLGIWLFIAPWIWGNSRAPSPHEFTSAWNAWILAVIVVIIALWALSSPAMTGVEWINVIAGIWLFIAPWVLGFAAAGHSAAWNQWVVGIIVFVLSLWAVNQAGRPHTRTGGTAAQT
jgi:hypothetical protein